MAKNLFNRYIWLVNTIYRNRRLTLKEINAKWIETDYSEGKEIPLRTFHNHREAIQDLFDININCDKSTYEYYIEDADEFTKGGVRNWLLNTFAVSDLINESHRVRDRIIFENIPSGQRFLAPLIEAIRDNQVLRLTYRGYNRSVPSEYEIEPYFLKIFKQRWYLIARTPRYEGLRVYALDRMIALTAIGKRFVFPAGFSPAAYMYDYFGIVQDESHPVTILVKAYDGQDNYLRDLPLHHSQEEVEQRENYTLFRYRLKPTYDFCQEILSFGYRLEVVSPENLRLRIKEMLEQTMARYC
ncbi:helix-turn-helix transcriptional regulator [Coprobacter tertius]|uniref:WYL domain-containing protein n=1 Tax=Coprobacter tertius TaxID=2944915 RepID=A0ABT1MK56_9BACT|nr:WYL domain-containing protein [Coprobacter tertius]MCP9611616.1 WYL domain-containing protein [Coprobacter tertius]